MGFRRSKRKYAQGRQERRRAFRSNYDMQSKNTFHVIIRASLRPSCHMRVADPLHKRYTNAFLTLRLINFNISSAIWRARGAGTALVRCSPQPESGASSNLGEAKYRVINQSNGLSLAKSAIFHLAVGAIDSDGRGRTRAPKVDDCCRCWPASTLNFESRANLGGRTFLRLLMRTLLGWCSHTRGVP